MQVIGFFRTFFFNLGGLVDFVNKPLGELNADITIEPFKSLSIIELFSASLVGVVALLLVIHIVRLFTI